MNQRCRAAALAAMAVPAALVAHTLLRAVPVRAEQSVRTVDRVDLERYAGEWFEIARYPNRFQRKCASDVRARYDLRPDGRIDVRNRCVTPDGAITDARGIARRAGDTSTAKLEVRFAPAVLSFLPAVWGDYWVLGLGEGYSWSVVGTPDRKYLWILARTPELAPDQRSAAEAVARANGFDTGRLVDTPHSDSAARRGSGGRAPQAPLR